MSKILSKIGKKKKRIAGKKNRKIGGKKAKQAHAGLFTMKTILMYCLFKILN